MQDKWLPNFPALSPGFSVFDWLPNTFLAQNDWPDLYQYNELIGSLGKVVNFVNLPIRFVDELATASGSYEELIYHTGQVKTRRCNWHDFFNMLVWLTFPKIKKAINRIHFEQQLSKNFASSTPRQPLENFLTLFDENGVVVVSSDERLLDLIRTMQWKELFWKNREILSEKMRVFVIGHSLHEKLLTPYIGLVGHTLLYEVEDNFFSQDPCQQISYINDFCACWLDSNAINANPRILRPFPLLGLPNWYPNNYEEFYDNTNYFRATRRLTNQKTF